MFNKLSENSRGKKQWYQIGQNLPILSAAALLADKLYEYCIEQIKELADLPENHFDFFYQSFIQRFVEFVQAIPEQWNEPLGSLLTHGLLRGINTLHLFVTTAEVSPTPLERYALFTACVLRDIHHVLVHQKVFITEKEGITSRVWQPFCGSLTEETEVQGYKLIPLSRMYQRIGKPLRPVLARQVMGENAYLWIASDIRLLAEWLEALNEDDDEGSGRLIHVIRRYRRDGGGLIDDLPMVSIDLLDTSATEYADMFYEWLIEGLNDGSIKVNRADAHVHITDGGVFVEFPGIFKTFADLYNVPVNHFVVFTQLGNLLGISRKGAHDYHHAQLFSEYPDTTIGRSGFLNPLGSKNSSVRDGFLISDVHSVYLNGKVPETTPYIKVPMDLKRSFQSLAEFNAIMKPNATMKVR